ncbi:MAG: hypothetical protein O7I93_13315 [Gemmatimonadetes bacterium]|nr:hypothetical protein [Gemmatimonadota bacterium]
MGNSRSIFRYLALAVVIATGVGLVAQPLAAQRRQPQNLKKILVLPPMPEDLADSIYVLQLAYELRDRLAGRVRGMMNVIPTERLCEALEASGFDCSFIPDKNSAGQLAQFLRADSYGVGTFRRNSVPRLTLRLVDLNRSGVAGWLTAVGEEGQDAEDFAKVVADSLRNLIDVADDARDCNARRDRNDFRGARDRADRVFREYPNHPAAAQCLAYLFEASSQPVDSIIWALERVVAGDSLLERQWERLAQSYLTKGDTLAAIRAFDSQLIADPNNAVLRLSVNRMWLETEDYDRAVEVLDTGLELNPADLELLRARARTCFTGERWPCAVESLGSTYEFDETLVGDSTFYRDILGAAELAGDTAGRLRWTEEAVTQLPNSLRFWAQRAALLAEVGDNDAALLAYRRISELDPENTRAPLGAASIILGGIVIDSATPLDTMALFEADSLMTFVAERDSSMHRSLAAFYYTTPSKMLQARPAKRPDIAIEWLEKALQYDTEGRQAGPASFFYGLAVYMYFAEFFAEMRESESCEMARRYEGLAMLGHERLTAGASIAQSTADQLLPALQQHVEYGPQFVNAFCTSN